MAAKQRYWYHVEFVNENWRRVVVERAVADVNASEVYRAARQEFTDDGKHWRGIEVYPIVNGYVEGRPVLVSGEVLEDFEIPSVAPENTRRMMDWTTTRNTTDKHKQTEPDVTRMTEAWKLEDADFVYNWGQVGKVQESFVTMIPKES